MLKRLSFINTYLVWYIPVFMVFGILYGNFYNAIPLKALIIPATILMIYPMMVTLNTSAVISKCNVKLQLTTQVINFILIPLAGYVIGLVFLKGSPLLAFGLLLMAVLPTSGMTISWTGFAKGNVNVAVKMTLIGLIAGSLLTPFYGKLLMGKIISIPVTDILQRIGTVIFIPLALGYLTQAFLVRKYGEDHFTKEIKPHFPVISTMAVLLIIFLAMALKAKMIVNNPGIILALLAPLVIFYAINYAVTTVIGKTLFTRADAIALVYGTVMRNLSVAMAIAITAFGKQGIEIALIIAVAYIFQVQSAAWYVRYAGKLFGEVPAEEPAEKPGDILDEGVFSLGHRATLQQAVSLLNEEHIHSIAVIDSENKPLGILTEIMVMDLLEENAPLEKRLGDLHLIPATTCNRTCPLLDIIRKMKQEHEYKVLVKNENGKCGGVLTKTDLLERLAVN